MPIEAFRPGPQPSMFQRAMPGFSPSCVRITSPPRSGELNEGQTSSPSVHPDALFNSPGLAGLATTTPSGCRHCMTSSCWTKAVNNWKSNISKLIPQLLREYERDRESERRSAPENKNNKKNYRG
ncbi:hypothetical protein RRG08_062501 [Elysia crispata]|uniref:Uncharacterized protein n=1 Tax=Elysia crispata TaxID=231223 RepID=A0AAE0ZYH9_9GAST|nr:hypothetical protein RRG08_062501 [Elysia crispata]